MSLAQSGQSISFRLGSLGLTPKQKELLAHRGTVERLLATFFGAEIAVKVVRQVEKKDRITEREAVLYRKDTGRALVHARSRIYCQNLPPVVVEGIRQQKRGIGSIIASARLDTARRIIDVGVNPDGSPYRTYRIYYNRRVAFEIREDLLF